MVSGFVLPDPPAAVRAKAEAAGALDWLRDLADLVAELSARWDLVVDGSFDDGTEAFVLAVTRSDATPAVVKLLVPRGNDVAHHEITVLRLVDGHGCAALLDDDESLGAMLLERLGPSLHDLGLPIARRHEVLVATAQRVWRPAAGCGLPTGADKGRWLIDHLTRLWNELDRPCRERTIAHAVACARRRIAAHDDERSVLVHGDIHEWNALQTIDPADGFKLVDPDGLLAEAEYDLGIIMRENPDDLLLGDPRERSRWLAARTGLDEIAIWEWGVVERVSTGLLCTQIGLQPVGRQMLHAADLVAELQND